jgi:uncharacterized membrane protein YgcG
MLGKLGIWRHLLVLVSIAGCAALALFGIIGGGNRDERFEAKQITVTPGGGDGVRIREVVDQDFGSERRHGYQRIIPNDFGEPTDITASSPNANADISTAAVYDSHVVASTRIRLGDPNTTYTGQHRYVLTYTLPAANLSSHQLALDIIGTDETLETGRFEVIVSGFTLTDPTCNVGSLDAVGGCTLVPEGSDYRVVFSPLRPGQGITIGGTITDIHQAVLPTEPNLPRYRADHRGSLAIAMLPLGLLGSLAVFVIAKRRGRNEVFSGGAAEAAYGQLPAPGGAASAMSTTLVSDARLAEMATTEFVPPKGLDPWQGAVLLKESIDDNTVSAWFSALAASEAITLTERNKQLVIGTGRRRSELDPTNAALVDRFMNGRDELTLGTYDPQFAGAWTSVKAQQAASIKASGWWKRRVPRPDHLAASGPLTMLIVLGVTFAIVGGSVASAVVGWFHAVPLAVAFGIGIPAFVALCVYSTLLPVRSATGSALALLTESFRRFLQASEGRHVEWAWQQGMLREYSAWAVALGAAEAWGKALANSNVPHSEYLMTNPLLVHSMAHSFSSSHVKPSSSSSGGGGFSGGSVGGGGGGGSSGSW